MTTTHIKGLLGLTALSQLIIAQPDTRQRPNIIYIMSDDHAWQAISAYGGPLKDYAPTPNIDRIAAEGIRFDRCLVTNSISGPCRAVILTGKYSHVNGFLTNDRQLPFDGSQQTFPKLLQKSGYNTAIIGKWHLDSEPTGFTHWEILPGQGDYYNPDFLTMAGRHTEHGYVTEIITEKSVAWIRQAAASGKPFMLMMHHKAPHREWQPGPKELGMYNKTKFPYPATLFDDYSGRGNAEKQQDMSIKTTMRLEEDLKLFRSPESLKETNLGRMDTEQLGKWNQVYDPIIKQFYGTPPEGDSLIKFKYQRYMQDYLACIAAVDKSVGRILDFLEESGLEKNTVVIYASDQGFFLGEHGWFDKRWMFEESYRTPLLVRWPGVTRPGTVNNDMVSNLDLAETFLEIGGRKIPGDMQGRSLVPLLKGKTPSDWRKEHYYHYYEFPGYHMVKKHYGISTPRYKLMHFYNDIDEWEMFDLQKDPLEMKNVYDDPSYAAVREELHAKLRRMIKKLGDEEAMQHEPLVPVIVESD